MEDDDLEMDKDFNYTLDDRKLDEKDFGKKLNQPKLSKHESDELFLME